MTRSVEVREELTEALRLDLIGPEPGGAYADEVLTEEPSSWYLTGFLVPYEAEEEVRRGDDADDALEVAELAGYDDDADDGERASVRRTWFASSIGLSVLLPAEGDGADSLEATVTWGDYTAEKPPKEERRRIRQLWRREQKEVKVNLALAGSFQRLPVPGSETAQAGCQGLQLVTYCRTVTAKGDLQGCRSVSVFLVNHRTPAKKYVKDQAFSFQAGFELSYERGFEPRTDPRGRQSDDYDERLADLHYRNYAEYAVGHGVASKAYAEAEGRTCRRVATAWTPASEVARVVPPPKTGGEVRMEVLAEADHVAKLLAPMVEAYGAWIEDQTERIVAGLKDSRRQEMAEHLLERASVARQRIGEGLVILGSDPVALKAFRITNRAMARTARQRLPHLYQDGEVPSWRPFQIAFLLMNLRAMVEPSHPDRRVVDLIFFPTGGGKTEAYLGLAAFTMLLRRLQNPGVGSSGLSVLMRYTLRLLTLDQLGRAAALICALELERFEDPELGEWPFEIGLWVGSGATPNRMGKKGDKLSGTARQLTTAYQRDSTNPPPIPLAECPWCNQEFSKKSFKLVGADGKANQDEPTNLVVRCLNRDCVFSPREMGHLPILAVDEPIYRRLPAFLIATADKFAALPWTGLTGGFFGQVERYDEAGFYGPCDKPGIGKPLPEGRLPPPDLIVQDELHLISGPLGTMAGLYETVIDFLATRQVDGAAIGPKIVASTATVRQAQSQIEALFARSQVEIFPPPGPDMRDSFFAETVPISSDEPGRLYLGVAAPGRSLKVVLLQTYVALLSAAQRLYVREAKQSPNPADPYMTLLGYFSSLKELGGSRRIVEDEVRTRTSKYSRRLRWGEQKGLYADRRLSRDVAELTSRESTDRVSRTKDRLKQPHANDGSIDVALATNMISVGLDISRLGLMVVLGQPKATAEYIQSTSRVGRDKDRSGLVVTLFNIHRPRDRSHYERFEAFHTTFYRSVEATSVTPFSPRAIDRGLPAVTVALARHGLPALTPPLGAGAVAQNLAALDFVADTLVDRFAGHRRWPTRQEEADAKIREQQLRAEVSDLLDAWERYAHGKDEGGLQYAPREVAGALPLLYQPLEVPPGHRFHAGRSLRDVEPSVNLWLRFPDSEDDWEEDEP